MRYLPEQVIYIIASLIIGCSSNSVASAGKPFLLYQQHCASCHHKDRLGGSGSALLPENLKRIKREQAADIIRDGLVATQMPAYTAKLSDSEIAQLVDFIYTPLDVLPKWQLTEIRQSHVIHHTVNQLGEKPVHKADPLNLFLVVESGDHHATILDGDSLEPIYRFKTRHALHGGPKYSPDGRFIYLASRDGWISKFDMYSLKLVAEIRAGINTRNIAASSDSRFVIVANYLPHSLVILNASDLSPVKLIPVENASGTSSRVSAVYNAPPRKSFIAALKDLPEIWEISYSDDPPYYGVVHDYRIEGPPEIKEPFPVRRIKLDDYLDDFFFDQQYEHLIGAARNSNKGQVVNLIVGRKIAEIDIPGLPHLGSGITWQYQDKPVLATPNLKEGVVSIIDMKDWKTIKRIETSGPGFFIRSHEKTRYAWVDVFFGPDKDVMHIIDKTNLEIIKTLRPVPGKTSAHVEFTRDGRYALLSIWDDDGALVVYDSATFQEVKRIPMKKPSGKYNVYNKIMLSSGTSH
jgi:DNA-binding beta-propeller fold protein YncE